MIEVRVRQEDVADRQTPALHGREQLIHLVAGIHDDALMRVLAADDESVLEEGLDRRVLQDHLNSVLALSRMGVRFRALRGMEAGIMEFKTVRVHKAVTAGAESGCSSGWPGGCRRR